MNENQDKFNNDIRQVLDHGEQSIDAATAARLRQARQQALAETAKPAFAWWPLGGVVALASVALLTLSLWLVNPVSDVLSPAMGDMELLATQEDFEFYEELEFYYWLESQEGVG